MLEQTSNASVENEVITYGSEIIVTINDRSVKVKKLGLIVYAQMSASLRGLITSILELVQAEDTFMVNEDDEKSPANQRITGFADIISKLLEKNIQQVIALLDIAVPELGRKYIENEVGLHDTLVLLDAIIKVNNINKVVNDGKKFLQNLLGN